jgi:hypothetical protein
MIFDKMKPKKWAALLSSFLEKGSPIKGAVKRKNTPPYENIFSFTSHTVS